MWRFFRPGNELSFFSYFFRLFFSSSQFLSLCFFSSILPRNSVILLKSEKNFTFVPDFFRSLSFSSIFSRLLFSSILVTHKVLSWHVHCVHMYYIQSFAQSKDRKKIGNIFVCTIARMWRLILILFRIFFCVCQRNKWYLCQCKSENLLTKYTCTKHTFWSYFFCYFNISIVRLRWWQ